MQKNLLVMSIFISISSYGISMEVSDEQVKMLLEQNNKHNNHNHKNNSETCQHACLQKKTIILKQIQYIRQQMNNNLLSRKEGNSQIERLKQHWNNEHPESLIK